MLSRGHCQEFGNSRNFSLVHLKVYGAVLDPHITGCLASLTGAHHTNRCGYPLLGCSLPGRTTSLPGLLDVRIQVFLGIVEWLLKMVFYFDISCQHLSFAHLGYEVLSYQFGFPWSMEVKVLMRELISLMFLLMQNTFVFLRVLLLKFLFSPFRR